MTRMALQHFFADLGRFLPNLNPVLKNAGFFFRAKMAQPVEPNKPRPTPPPTPTPVTLELIYNTLQTLQKDLTTMGTTLGSQLNTLDTQLAADMQALTTQIAAVAAAFSNIQVGDPVTQAQVDAASALDTSLKSAVASLTAAITPPATPAPTASPSP